VHLAPIPVLVLKIAFWGVFSCHFLYLFLVSPSSFFALHFIPFICLFCFFTIFFYIIFSFPVLFTLFFSFKIFFHRCIVVVAPHPGSLLQTLDPGQRGDVVAVHNAEEGVAVGFSQGDCASSSAPGAAMKLVTGTGAQGRDIKRSVSD
jgi:hypothetical protein